MKARLLTITAIAAIALTSALAGCTENPVGRKCFIGGNVDAGAGGTTIVSSPALECPSRVCLHTPQERELPVGSEYADLCTAECSKDDECDKVAESPCQLGFACTIVTTTGPFCCRKLCVCKDYIIIPDGGLQQPASCDPDNPINQCINLPGR